MIYAILLGKLPYMFTLINPFYTTEHWKSLEQFMTDEGSFPSKSACIIGLNMLKQMPHLGRYVTKRILESIHLYQS